MYTPASTANPLGFRPWNSRLSFYLANSFPLPTTGLGVDFPNQPSFLASRSRYPRPDVAAMQPRIYLPPEAHLRGLGAARRPRRPLPLPRPRAILNPRNRSMRGLGQLTPVTGGTGGTVQFPGVTIQYGQPISTPGTFQSITNWLTESSIVSWLPNWVLVGGAFLLLYRRR
jgi:hypothetical protein